MEILKSLFYFLAAGLFEIGGGYLVWLSLREQFPWYYGAAGALVLVLYGVIPTLQPESTSFGRVYAAYGGIFILLSVLWGWRIDHAAPDFYDLLGSAVALAGTAIIMYAPRN